MAAIVIYYLAATRARQISAICGHFVSIPSCCFLWGHHRGKIRTLFDPLVLSQRTYAYTLSINLGASYHSQKQEVLIEYLVMFDVLTKGWRDNIKPSRLNTAPARVVGRRRSLVR